MIFETEIDRRQISQGLVGPSEIVFDKPFSKGTVKLESVLGHVTQTDKLVLQGTVEPLVDRVVFGSFNSRPVMLQVESLAGFIEMPVKFAAIISLDIFNLSVKKDMEAVEKIPSRYGTVIGIHSGKSDFRMTVDGGQDIAFLPPAVAHDGIQAQEKSRNGLALKLGDFLFSPGHAAFAVDSGLF